MTGKYVLGMNIMTLSQMFLGVNALNNRIERWGLARE